MRVFFKVTAWECVDVSDDIYMNVIKGIQDNTIETADELIELFPDSTIYNGIELETSAQMSLDDNDYAPTIEVYNNKHDKVFDNGVKL